MENNKIIQFPSGNHSFYGMFKAKLISGHPKINGLTLKVGEEKEIYAPHYTLPVMFRSDESFSLSLECIENNKLTSFEKEFYPSFKAMKYFTEVLPKVHYSSSEEGPKYESDLIEDIKKEISSTPKTFFIAGNQGTGKSTLSRLISNMIIEKHGCVGYLNVDVGQPEIGMPCSVSFAVIKDYILSPPENRTYLPQISYFYGSKTYDDVFLFYKIISRIINELPKDVFIVVNSFGWIEGPGKEIHEKLLKIISPDKLYLLKKTDAIPELSYKNMMISKTTPKQGKKSISPKILRHLRVVTYFNNSVMKKSLKNPHRFQMKSLRIGFINDTSTEEEVLNRLKNKNIVGLCCDTKSLETNNNSIILLRKKFPMKCKGFGIVTGVDVENGVICVASNESKEDLDEINALMFCDIEIPKNIEKEILITE